MSSLANALDKEMREASPKGSHSAGEHSPESSSGRAQSAGPVASHIKDRLNESDERRSSSRGSVGIPFAMPSASRRRNIEATQQLEMLPSIEAQAMPERAPLSPSFQFDAIPKGRSLSSSYGVSAGKRQRHGSDVDPLDRSKSGSPRPRRPVSPAVRALSPTLSRLTVDDDGDESAAAESSVNGSDSSDRDDGWGPEKSKERGRQRTRKESGGTDSMGREIITAKSLFAAAAAEHRDTSLSYKGRKTRSRLDPTISVIGPNGEKMVRRNSSGIVHPHTSFDQGGSGLSSPLHSDHEDSLADIRSAQQLSLNISPIQSSPEAHRCVRQVIRGDYSQFAEDAQKGLRRQRVYLVSTDLSDEAAYALEWTIGTVLRDGDTLLAVYAVDEEIGVAASDSSNIQITGRQESDHLKRTLSNHDGISGSTLGSSALSNSIMATEANVSAMGKAEKERYQACVEVSNRCVKLLRKTRLQVRAVVEVFHCKSPKHMITEVIDFLEPTLVILGSRGRNALKGVLLGSFSNYLVTKSSVPVMVARKRLRKHSKYKRQNIRMSNLLANPNDRLANAKID